MRLSHDVFYTLLESSPNGLLVIDAEARIVFVNEFAERMLGYGRDELLDKRVETLVPERFRISHMELRRAFTSVPRDRPMGMGRDLWARRRDGKEIPVEIGLKPIRSEGHDLVLVVLVDISARKRIEERQRLLIGELNHRIQNLFAVIQSVALHSLGGNRPLLETREVFIDRLQSLGRAYTMMNRAGVARRSAPANPRRGNLGLRRTRQPRRDRPDGAAEGGAELRTAAA
ncbi:MAG: PAS domain S-box protein [Rhodoplanes sp.]